ncbi:Glu-tRNA(Gln) amidotransferase subunit GatE [Halobacterium salinarum]|uniref:Glutamyl-tRNA(Gln) amidotransferase subunit E n=5 Tax=Halobacterium salinarum TaxID=2242 RepID=GATE_HALSA|nr:Glu-tRNA(Gln) amidotransferase subunit GatE [Halobacterium salinarum]B0R5F0.1 RecName: Full=Glutamyl-tRNA(Gln) amidotransferase subunit E; Short=Glu-ADT subunit E [Halobacterium salinarum R1]Q9HQ32.1 RecName: Full=Glutamyl-tRNA(Gln) amidotransferase subunit E; Short=Glu-ADT subunit E [Halobacterium salinarum NRC-1]AAG19685.1 Glu-tRNA amidotransferase [Halobacterium salinarum NRC-1]MBB6088687.1 glutamyl-tRNA(Gln) amidotransferase subunit E [Halobacterium salinarum]MDL0118905.1 Glu-tRNA(Gln) 
MTEFDYDELGLVAGLEIHQQLDTATKLFCACPTTRREPAEADRTFTRYLHPTRSELGEIDEAALEESRVEREFEYLAYDTTCLVEEDDEPPHRLDEDALAAALEIGHLLGMDAVDRAHVMRKVVIDGSNTGGFQRSTMVAEGGAIDTSEGPVGIEDLMLEEESAQRIEDREDGVLYSLDRLGIPLVEIGTKPDISSPAQAREAAERIGMLLRSTGKVKRGLGTIRQDVNVSIADGARVEMKGVQSLDDIDDLVREEVRRQVELLDIVDELDARDAAVGKPRDVTDVFADTESGVIRGALDDGGEVHAVPLHGFDGLVGRELQADRRLGTEFSDHATRHGAGGIFHTDELPAYGVTAAEVAALRDAVGAGEDDAVAIVADDPETAAQSIQAVAERAETAMAGVPEETRGANDDGTSKYLRPLPGAARMYPETDVPPVDPDPSAVETPELLTEKVERYQADFDLDAGLAEQVAYGRRWQLFEQQVEAGVDATLAAQTLESTVTELRRDDVPVGRLTDAHFRGVLGLVADGDLAQEGVPELLAALAEQPGSDPAVLAEELGLGSAAEDEVREAVVGVVERNSDQVAAEGMGAFSALMGECMGALRGKADGDLVSEVLREEIQQRS